MSKSCVYMPQKGKTTFVKLKENFGYARAATIFNKVIGEDFLDRYGDSLTLDSEGVPTYQSILQNPVVKNYLGAQDIIMSLQKDMPIYDDTASNAGILVTRAIELNKSPEYSDYVAYVDYTEDGRITIKFLERNEENLEIAEAQSKIQRLNEKVSEILSSAGVSLSFLSSIETSVGRVGLTNFNHAKDIANNFTGLIQIANNMEGVTALSEEFSHLLVGLYRDNPLIQRSINLFNDEGRARAVLGDEYDDLLEYYDGNTAMIAEEVVGQLLREQLLNQLGDRQSTPLIDRAANYIKRLYKGINPGYYQNAIDYVAEDLGAIAKEFLESKRTFTKEDIVKARRNATFNALTERAKAQVKVLREAIENSSKASYLQENLDEKPEGQRTEKSQARQTAERMNKEVNKRINAEETMAAIAAYLDIAVADVEDLFKDLQGLENLSIDDRFRVLRNALYIAQSYAPTLEELRRVTTAEFIEDEGIASQEFMASDTENKLKEFETTSEVEPVDTSEMSNEEIGDRIVDDSSDFELSEDETYYINTRTGEKFKRVTSIIEADREAGEPFDPNNPWTVPSTNIGTGVDEFVRDFLSGRIILDGDTYKVEGKDLSEVYPNADNRSLNMLARQLEKFAREQSELGIELIPRDVVASGTITTVDANRQTHTVNVAGTLDLLGYDDKGNWYIYDMKTHHGNNIGMEKKAKYARQLSLYKQLLEKKYGIKVNSLKIIPIKVNYPGPEGTDKGNTKYTVSENKPEGYNGRRGNQLIADGKEYKGARPFLEELIDVEEKKIEVDYKKASGDLTGGIGDGTLAVREGIKALQNAYSEFITLFSEKALPQFVLFLKPFVGDNIKIVTDRKRWADRGIDKEVSIEQVIKESPADVTLMQQLFNSIADNPNALLQIFNQVIKIVKDDKRLKVIEKAQQIIALGKEFEDKGITDYSKFFEEDKENYLIHLIIDGKDYSYDKSAYEKAKKEHFDYLDSVYGANPEIGSDDYLKRNAAREHWLKGDESTEGREITVKDESGKEHIIPNYKYFPSKYNSLTATEREFFDRWIQMKGELDELIGPNHTYLTNTIKIRKNGIERLRGVFSGKAITEFVEEAKSKVMKSFDDNMNYASGIMGFTGEEIMKLPLYYINSKGKAGDISTDMIGTLIAYAEMAYNYDAMSSIANPLEIGRYLVEKNLKIGETRGNKPVMESFTVGGRTITNPIKVPTAASNLKKAMDDLFESKIYGRYLKDSGEVGPVDVNKAANLLLKLGSTVQLGFNVFAWLANATTGAAMQRIEAITGEFFNYKELANADKEFFKALGHYVGDIGQRVQTSKLHLFDEMFDVRQNFKTQKSHIDFNNRNLLTRIFGPGIQYIGQDAGDHWLYNRTAIAIALRYKLKDKNNNSISLWDALEVVPVDKNNPEFGTKLVLKDGVTKEDGSAFTKRDISNISGRMRYVNQHMFGIYNEEDSIGARRTLWGRFLMQYRDWIPAQFRYRFGRRTTNLEKGGDVEGYYRTTARFIKQVYTDVMRGQATLSQVWKDLDDYDRKNVVRARTELLQWVAVCALVALLKRLDDDKDRPWAIRAAKYLATREKTELGALVPFSMPKEMLTIAKSPFANTSVISDLWNLGLLLNPMNYTDEIQSGDYKGHSSAYRAFMRSPLTLWYRTIKRTAHPEKAEQFYNSNK